MSAGLELFLIFVAALLSRDVIVKLAQGNTLLLAIVAAICLLLAVSSLVISLSA